MKVVYQLKMCQALDNTLFQYFYSDGETFLSGDDLRINVWNLEVRDQCFNIIDMKPKGMEDLTGNSGSLLKAFHML